MHKHDIICLSETYLDSSIYDGSPEMESYNLVRADHSNNIKRGRGGAYYNESILLN